MYSLEMQREPRQGHWEDDECSSNEYSSADEIYDELRERIGNDCYYNDGLEAYLNDRFTTPYSMFSEIREYDDVDEFTTQMYCDYEGSVFEDCPGAEEGMDYNCDWLNATWVWDEPEEEE